MLQQLLEPLLQIGVDRDVDVPPGHERLAVDDAGGVVGGRPGLAVDAAADAAEQRLAHRLDPVPADRVGRLVPRPRVAPLGPLQLVGRRRGHPADAVAEHVAQRVGPVRARPQRQPRAAVQLLAEQGRRLGVQGAEDHVRLLLVVNLHLERVDVGADGRRRPAAGGGRQVGRGAAEPQPPRPRRRGGGRGPVATPAVAGRPQHPAAGLDLVDDRPADLGQRPDRVGKGVGGGRRVGRPVQPGQRLPHLVQVAVDVSDGVEQLLVPLLLGELPPPVAPVPGPQPPGRQLVDPLGVRLVGDGPVVDAGVGAGGVHRQHGFARAVQDAAAGGGRQLRRADRQLPLGQRVVRPVHHLERERPAEQRQRRRHEHDQEDFEAALEHRNPFRNSTAQAGV